MATDRRPSNGQNHLEDALKDLFELALAPDGVASLLVFNDPFSETENMQFLSQISPDDSRTVRHLLLAHNSDTIIATDINNGLIVMRLSDEPCRSISCSK